MKVACLGLGPMGAAMAGRLVGHHELTVWNRSAGKAYALVRAGSRMCTTPADAAHDVDLVVTSLATDEALEAVMLGRDGAAAAMRQGAVHLSTSTISPVLSQRLSERHREAGQVYIACPVLGRPPAAAAGQLFLMPAGPADAIDRLEPIFALMGQRVFRLGERPEVGNLMKLLCNFLIFSTIEQMGEVFAVGEKGGIDRATLFEVLTESFFNAPVHKNYGRLILERAYDPPGATVMLGAKDTALMLRAAEGLGAPMPMASLVRDRFVSASGRGESGLDFSVIARHAADDAGIER